MLGRQARRRFAEASPDIAGKWTAMVTESRASHIAVGDGRLDRVKLPLHVVQTYQLEHWFNPWSSRARRHIGELVAIELLHGPQLL